MNPPRNVSNPEESFVQRSFPFARRTAGAMLVSVVLAAPALAQRPRSDDKAAPPKPTIDASLLSGIQWRNIGPFRGGRATTATGVPGQPLVYYMGATGGGIWKTEDAGITWKPIADG